MSIDCAVEPSIGSCALSSDCDRFIAVCPPNCTMDGGMTTPSSVVSIASFSSMSRTDSSSSGSKYSLSLVSKSVETVSGFEFTITLWTPSSWSAHAA